MLGQRTPPKSAGNQFSIGEDTRLFAPFDYLAYALVAALGAMMSWHFLARIQARFLTQITPVVLLLIAIVAGWALTERADRNARNAIREQHAALAPTYAHEMEVLGHASLPDTADPGDARFRAMAAAQKRWIEANPDVGRIYTIRRKGPGHFVVLVDSKTETNVSGNPDQAFEGTATFTETPVVDHRGTWISEFHPIRDSAGMVEAVLGVDYAADDWFTTIQQARLTVLGYLSLILALVLGGVGMALAQHRHHDQLRQSEARAAAISETEERRSQEALTVSAQRLQSIFDATVEGIIVADATGAIESMHPAALRIFGYEADELFGRSIATILPDIGSATPAEGLARLTTLVRAGESTGRRRDRTSVPIDLAVSSMELGNVPTFIATVSDIALRKAAEQERIGYLGELEAAKASVEGATRAKSDFLATMSHEIRTPMNGVIGMIGLLLETPLNAEQREYATTVKSSAESLLTIINDILDFSKIEAGWLSFEPLPFDLRTAIEETVDLMTARAAEKGLRLAARFAPGTPRYLIGDVGRVRQILLNYTGNSIKFTGEGHVLIEVSCDELTATHAHLRLAITDTGIGIPPEQQDRLFRKFSQADASTTRKYGGTGLGLAICKQLAELMGGEVGLASTVGQGSTFWATIRLELDPASSDQRSHPALAGVRTLYLDSDPIHRLILAEQCGEWGMRIDAADSATRALDLVVRAGKEGDPYRLIIVDHGATTTAAAEFAHSVKAIGPADAGPVMLLMSDGGTRGRADQYASAGFSGYLTRPVRSGTLADTLEALVAPRCEIRRPAVDPVPAATPTATPDPTLRLVLLVDDNVVNQKVGAKMLEKMGCRVNVVSNGLEAVEAWARLPYEIVFMDCQMPEMDGYEATGEIRRREGTGARVPIVALTANAMQGDREKCLEAGMDDYLSKPIKPDDLRAALARWPSQAPTQTV